MRCALLVTIPIIAATPLTAQTATEGYVLLAEEIEQPPVAMAVSQAFYPIDATIPIGRVVLKLVVQKDGHVRPGSLSVVKAPDSLFAAAARETALATTFSPGRHRNKPEPTLLDYTVIVRVVTPRCEKGVVRSAVTLCADSSATGRGP